MESLVSVILEKAKAERGKDYEFARYDRRIELAVINDGQWVRYGICED